MKSRSGRGRASASAVQASRRPSASTTSSVSDSSSESPSATTWTPARCSRGSRQLETTVPTAPEANRRLAADTWWISAAGSRAPNAWTSATSPARALAVSRTWVVCSITWPPEPSRRSHQGGGGTLSSQAHWTRRAGRSAKRAAGQGGGDPGGGLLVDGHRLLDEERQAGLDGGQLGGAVGERRDADVDGVQALGGQQLHVVGVGGGPGRGGQLAGPLQGRVGHPGHLDPVHGQQRPHVAGRDRARPDHADPYRRGHSSRIRSTGRTGTAPAPGRGALVASCRGLVHFSVLPRRSVWPTSTPSCRPRRTPSWPSCPSGAPSRQCPATPSAPATCAARPSTW